MNDRIEAARERLNAALLAGEDTMPHRQAIEALTAKEQQEAERERKKQGEQDTEISELVSVRAKELADESLHRLDSITQKHRIPERL